MEMNAEARNQFINSVKKITSEKIDNAKQVGDRRFETNDEAIEAMELAKTVAPDKHFEINKANGKFFVEVK